MIQPGLPNIPRISSNCSFLIHDKACGSNTHRLTVSRNCAGASLSAVSLSTDPVSRPSVPAGRRRTLKLKSLVQAARCWAGFHLRSLCPHSLLVRCRVVSHPVCSSSPCPHPPCRQPHLLPGELLLGVQKNSRKPESLGEGESSKTQSANDRVGGLDVFCIKWTKKNLASLGGEVLA